MELMGVERNGIQKKGNSESSSMLSLLILTNSRLDVIRRSTKFLLPLDHRVFFNVLTMRGSTSRSRAHCQFKMRFYLLFFLLSFDDQAMRYFSVMNY